MTADAPPDVSAGAPADVTPAPGAGLTGPESRTLSLASRAVHADDHISAHRAVAPAMHVSTTFRYSDDPDSLEPWGNVDVSHPPALSTT